jgi:hypothetical protein
MFYCQACNKLSQPGEKPRRVVVETRDRVYTRKKGDKEIILGRGTEIVREVDLCTPCAEAPSVN